MRAFKMKWAQIKMKICIRKHRFQNNKFTN